MRDCKFRLVEASRDENGNATLSEKEAENLLNEIKDISSNKILGEDTDLEDAIIDDILERTYLAKQNTKIQKRNALINLQKKKELESKLERFIQEDGLSVRGAFETFLVGMNGKYYEGRSSVDNKSKAMVHKYLGEFVKDLESEDLLQIVNQKGLQKEIEIELWNISHETDKTGITGSKEAKRIAEIIYKSNEALRIRQNRAGANISKLESFTTTQTHDRRAIQKDGYVNWSAKILPLLDKDLTFKGADPDKFLKSVYEVLTTGVSKRKEVTEKLFDFKGPANLAKKISKERVLHFKDAESALAYRESFGKKDFMEGVLGNIERSSRNIALLESLGTNPRAMFETTLNKFQEKYRADSNKVAGAWDKFWINNFFDEVDGTTLMAEVPTVAAVGSFIRGWQSLTKLGGVILSSITDIPLKAAELQYQGYDIFKAYNIAFSDIGKGLSSKERRELGATIGVGIDGMLGNIASRFTAQDDLNGKLSKLMRLFFKVNGLQWWTDAHKLGTGLAMSNRLAQIKHLPFNQLDNETKLLFGNFGINEKDWDIIKKSAIKQLDGNEYITPDAIQQLDDTLFTGDAQKAKDILEDKLRGYILDRVDFATLTPDAKERAFLNVGTKRGTLAGELVRTMTQFKSFPIAVISKIYGRNFYGKGKADLPVLAQTIIMTTLMGYVAMTAKDTFKGRKPRPLDNKSTWVAAFTQGGGAGIMGDFFFGEYNRFGQDLTTTLAGPSASTLNDIAKIFASIRNGDDLAAKTLNTTINNTPFANLFYLRPALNYTILYQLQEQLNPGYLRRMERRVQKENNQEFFIKPTSFR